MNTSEIARTLSELGNETRLDIFRLLIKRGPSGMSIGDIGTELSIAASTLAFHLKGLAQSGLITQEKQGRHTVCRANLDALTTVLRQLENECCIDEDTQADERNAS